MYLLRAQDFTPAWKLTNVGSHQFSDIPIARDKYETGMGNMWQICSKYEANIRQLWDKYVTNMTQIWGTLLQCSDIPTARAHWRELHFGGQASKSTTITCTIQKRQIKKRFDLILKHLEIRRLSDAIVQPQQLTIDLAFQTCCNNNNLESLHVWHVDKIVPTHVYLPAGT